MLLLCLGVDKNLRRIVTKKMIGQEQFPTFSAGGALVRVPNRLGKKRGDTVEVHEHRGGTVVVRLGDMVFFDTPRLLDTTARFEYETVR